MTVPSDVDVALVEWGERLFYPGNRIVRSAGTPRLTALSIGHRAAVVRARLARTFHQFVELGRCEADWRWPRPVLRSKAGAGWGSSCL